MRPARPLLARQAGALSVRPCPPGLHPPAASTPGGGGDAPPADAARVPRLVADADLLRSLAGEVGDPLPRSFAPPAEPRICRCCAGTAHMACPTCAGQGTLPPGGYRATNPVLIPKIVGTTWTAAERTLGRTHFRVADKRRAAKMAGTPPGGGAEEPSPSSSPLPGSGSNAWFVLMVSACDPSVRLWVEARALKDRARWTPGWVTVADIVARRAEDEEQTGSGRRKKRGVGPRAGAGCKACGGGGRVPCRLCSRPGEVIEV